MTHDTHSTDPTRIAFMCVRNAGRSQMSTAFAEREQRRRGLQDRIEILTGGTDPADAVHDVVIDAMDEVDIDVSDRTPRAITESELRSCDVVATMGCSTLDVGTVGDDVDVRDWALADPGEQDLDDVRAIRDEIEERVAALFDELAAAE
jgi:protein-tyrosine-phosphatase